MRDLLVYQGLEEALKGAQRLPDLLGEQEKKELLNKTHDAIILSQGETVWTKVSKEKFVAGIWSKVESLYMTKSLVKRLLLKQALYSFKMQDDKYVDEQVDEFNKTVLDLENIDVSIAYKDKTLLLLCSLLVSY